MSFTWAYPRSHLGPRGHSAARIYLYLASPACLLLWQKGKNVRITKKSYCYLVYFRYWPAPVLLVGVLPATLSTSPSTHTHTHTLLSLSLSLSLSHSFAISSSLFLEATRAHAHAAPLSFQIFLRTPSLCAALLVQLSEGACARGIDTSLQRQNGVHCYRAAV